MKLNAKQLGAMLRIQAAGRVDDPARQSLKLHHATRKALISRDMAFIGANGGLHLTNEGRRELLSRLAGTVAPCAARRPCLAVPEPRIPVLVLDDVLELPPFPFIKTSIRRRMTYSKHTVH